MRRRLWAAGLAVPALLAGCADTSTQPARLPPLSSRAPSASPSPAPSPSPSPTEAQAVEAAVRFYFEGFNRALKTGDPGELARGSFPDCNCRSAVDKLRKVLKQGTAEGNTLTVESVEVASIKDSIASVTAVYSTTPGRVLGQSGQSRVILQAETHARRAVFLGMRDGGWLVSFVDVLRS